MGIIVVTCPPSRITHLYAYQCGTLIVLWDSTRAFASRQDEFRMQFFEPPDKKF